VVVLGAGTCDMISVSRSSSVSCFSQHRKCVSQDLVEIIFEAVVRFVWSRISKSFESIFCYSHVKQLHLDDFRLHANNLARINERVCARMAKDGQGWPRIAKDVRILESFDGAICRQPNISKHERSS
jgi:hypothetical protein